MNDAAPSPADAGAGDTPAPAEVRSAAPPAPPRPAADHGEVPGVVPLVYHLVLAVTHLPVYLRGMRVEVHGREHVPPPGTPLVVAAKHVTGLDPFLVARALPPGRFLQFMAKKELFGPVVGPIISAGGSFPVDRETNDVGAIRASLRILARGGTVGIFPQGTRGGQELHGGVALIAAKGRAPILPVGLCRQGRRWVVRFGEPLSARGGIKAVTAALGAELDRLSRPQP
ncbi:lysophospholipid acyltransferase family protein [Deinococcus petrolearius]|uniref:Lysophospholipid acyltransferase family protein n=1 Tax=Deinococcus petrolearius TaxID=1751295 RepID=A0ABW1DIB7_9DEIO